ncbi:hypothetical protein, partial [Mycobacteroides abscessus]
RETVHTETIRTTKKCAHRRDGNVQQWRAELVSARSAVAIFRCRDQANGQYAYFDATYRRVGN